MCRDTSIGVLRLFRAFNDIGFDCLAIVYVFLFFCQP